VQTFFDTVEESFGRVDALVNNAWPRTADWMSRFEDIPAESFYRNLCDHAGGFFLCCQRVARTMRRAGQGVIVNLGSIYGEVGPHFPIYEGTDMTCPAAYPFIKGGIHAFTRYLATYLAPDNIRVNCLSPGGVRNDAAQDPDFIRRYEAQTPLGRMAGPEDMIGPLVFLLSEASRYVTGQILFADGGWTAW